MMIKRKRREKRVFANPGDVEKGENIWFNVR